eukprot:6815867-Alexandrium_andersonii.AAC.1
MRVGEGPRPAKRRQGPAAFAAPRGLQGVLVGLEWAAAARRLCVARFLLAVVLAQASRFRGPRSLLRRPRPIP